jgi:rhodanese-related sulfurtransferase
VSVQLAATELAKKLHSASPPHLLDVREEWEHRLVSLPGSKLIPLAQIPFRADEIESWKDEEVVVYCHHGVRSLMAIGALRTIGFKHLKNLAGGIDAWSLEAENSTPRY